MSQLVAIFHVSVGCNLFNLSLVTISHVYVACNLLCLCRVQFRLSKLETISHILVDCNLSCLSWLQSLTSMLATISHVHVGCNLWCFTVTGMYEVLRWLESDKHQNREVEFLHWWHCLEEFSIIFIVTSIRHCMSFVNGVDVSLPKTVRLTEEHDASWLCAPMRPGARIQVCQRVITDERNTLGAKLRFHN